MPKPYFNIKNNIRSIIRVNHAGEFGAKVIYQGQIDFTSSVEERLIIQKMQEQELEHLKFFEDTIKSESLTHIWNNKNISAENINISHKYRPSLLLPIWSKIGYYAGALSAKLGASYTMLLTENIEKVIVSHYQSQCDFLEPYDQYRDLRDKIAKFQNDEEEHIHIAIMNYDQQTIAHKIFAGAVKAACKVAIYISKKI